MPRRRRQKGSGAVRKLPSGRWQARVQSDSGPMVSLGSFVTKTDAERAIINANADQARGAWVDPRAGRITFEQYAIEWLAHRSTIRPLTRELYASQLRKHLLPAFGHVELSKVTTPAVRQWHARMVASPKPGQSTVAKLYRLLRTILATAVEDGYLANNPCIINGAGVERSPERPVATIAQVYEIANAVEPRYRMLVLLATFASMRFGELAALTRSRIDLATGLITIKEAVSEFSDGTWMLGDPKTPAGIRTVAVPAVILHDLADHLDTYAEPGRDGLIFVGPLGGPLRRGNWNRNWRHTADSLGYEGLHFHDLRHTGNTLAAATGASTRELMTRMGHSSSRAALLYQHATRERELAIAAKLNEMVLDARGSAAPIP